MERGESKRGNSRSYRNERESKWDECKMKCKETFWN